MGTNLGSEVVELDWLVFPRGASQRAGIELLTSKIYEGRI